MARAADLVRIVLAATAYFAIVFAGGFVLGAIRMLVLAPRIGALAAVLVEAPIMIAIAWGGCRWLLGRFAIGPAPGGRLAMGAVAFALLIVAELILAVTVFGASAVDFVAAYGTPAGAVGLAAQLVFAAMPLLVRVRPGNSDRNQGL